MAIDPLERRPIGRTAVQITRFGFGGTTLGGRHVYRDVGDVQAFEAVAAAHAEGVRYFDTAPYYGAGQGEARMGAALQRIGDPGVTLSTKVGYLLEPPTTPEEAPRPVLDFSYEAAMLSYRESLKRLEGARIDLAFIHDADKGPYLPAAMAGTYRALGELRAQGRIRAIGVGIADWRLCLDFAAAGEFDCFMLAGRYTLLEQGGALHELLPLCAQRSIGLIVAAPFNSGILATGAVAGARHDNGPAAPAVLDRVAQIERVCAVHGVPLRAAALQFPLAHPAVTGLVAGSRSAAEVRQNLDDLRRPLPGDFWDELRHEKLVDPAAPTPSGI